MPNELDPKILEALESQRVAMTQLLADHHKPDVVESSGRYFKWIQAIIGLVAVLLSLGVSYGVTTANLSTQKDAIEKAQGDIKELEKDYKEQVAKLENDIQALQLSQVRDDQLFKAIKETLNEVKQDVKTLIRGR